MAALAVALLCAPGTWLRSDMARHDLPAGTVAVSVEQIAALRVSPAAGWTVAGIWHLASGHLHFGGFSALIALDDGRLQAFSDRGYGLTFTPPDGSEGGEYRIARQFIDRALHYTFWDIEAATRDSATGTYWLATEQTHAIHRFASNGTLGGTRNLTALVAWPSNAGIEAMVRLADGRFVVLPEYDRTGLIFPADPVAGGAPKRFAIMSPAEGFAITGAKQLPDGRLLVLMRDVVSPARDGWPPFASLLAIGEVPEAGGTFAPQITLDLAQSVPRENYEGLALRERDDGRIDVWIVADDNFSLFQRTLLVKLVFAPLVADASPASAP